MAKHVTDTGTLPAEMQALYELDPLPGGPRYALPHYGQGEVDFSTLTVPQAEALIARGFPYLRRKEQPATWVEETPPQEEEKTPRVPRKRKEEHEEGE